MAESEKRAFGGIRRLLTPPVFPGDEDRTRIAGLLNTILLFYVVTLLLLTLITLALQGSHPLSGSGLWILVVLAALVAGAYVLLRLGRVQAAGWLFLVVLWAVYTGVFALSDGPFGPAVAIYIMLLITVGLILGGRPVIVFAGLSVLAGALFLAARAAGRVPAPSLLADQPSTLALLVFCVGQATAMLVLAVEGIGDALDHAQRKEREMVQRNGRLRMIVEGYSVFMADVACGNLAARLHLEEQEGENGDPLAALGRQLNEAAASLQGMAGHTREAVRGLGAAVAQILVATTRQVGGASEQSAAISQTAIAAHEVRDLAEQVVVRAQQVADASQRTAQVSQAGRGSVQETVESMTRVRERVEGIAESILALAEQTLQIGEIIATVSDLAAQSNLLALNASVEAARAGEQGKGFAVVAEEVRSLAIQSAHAAAQVRAILSEVQAATISTVMATEEGALQVEEGVQRAARTGEAIVRLAEVIDESAGLAAQMVAGGRQQVAGMEQVAQAIASIEQATVQGLSSTQQAERAAQDLHRLAQTLSETVARYQL